MERQRRYWIAGAGVIVAVIVLLASMHSARLRGMPPLSFFTPIATPVIDTVTGTILPPALNSVHVSVSVRDSAQAQLQVFFGGQSSAPEPFFVDLGSIPAGIDCSTQVTLTNPQQANSWSFGPQGTCRAILPIAQGVRLELIGAPGTVVDTTAGEWSCRNTATGDRRDATGVSITLPQSWLQQVASVDCVYAFHLR